MSTFKSSFLFMVLLIMGCTTESNVQQLPTTSQANIYQELLLMEYNLLNKNYEATIQHSNTLDALLKDNYNLFCVEESAQIDGARMSNAILKKNIEDGKMAYILEDLRILKATIINLDTDEDFDPFFAFLWRFEEDMHMATETAIDPMLDLFEWNEFEAMVACMNDSWQPVRMHYPSPEILGHNSFKYKNQTTYKIYLEHAVQNFITAVDKVDHVEYPICESAEELREAYKNYIYSFIRYQQDPDFFLAKL